MRATKCQGGMAASTSPLRSGVDVAAAQQLGHEGRRGRDDFRGLLRVEPVLREREGAQDEEALVAQVGRGYPPTAQVFNALDIAVGPHHHAARRQAVRVDAPHGQTLRAPQRHAGDVVDHHVRFARLQRELLGLLGGVGGALGAEAVRLVDTVVPHGEVYPRKRPYRLQAHPDDRPLALGGGEAKCEQ
jgi:hypothetical protein